MNKKIKHSIVTEDASVKTTENRKKILPHIIVLISMLAICFACTKSGGDIIDEDDNFDEEEIIDGTVCSELGMIPNDKTQGTNNRKILINALNDGINLLVDNKYYLTGLGTPAKVNSDIVIAGITDNAEFSFTKTSMTQSNFINIATSNLLMRKLRFTSINDEAVYAFRLSDTHKMKTLSIENCYFEGPIRLVNWSYTNSIYPDPDQDDYGIENFKFTNNTCKNIRESFIVLNNVPIKHSQVIKNTITNFSNIFYCQEITNVNVHVDRLAPKMAYLEVRENKVINDLSWNGMFKDQMYHCFVFFEGDKCDYKYNHVEGLHIFDKSTNVYDAYISCINLEYENNFWKNNILFNSDPSYLKARQLIKCKNAPRLNGYKNIKRIIRNNTFIVEKSYAERLGRDPEELWVTMSEFDNEMESVVLEKNKIDVYILRFSSATVLTHNYTFSNNEIHAYKTRNNAHNCILPITREVNDAVNGAYIAKGNKINIDMPGEVTTRSNSLVRFMIPGERVKYVKVSFEDNIVSWPDLSVLVSSANSMSAADTDISITNNTVTTEKKPNDKTNSITGTIDLTGNNFTVTGGG